MTAVPWYTQSQSFLSTMPHVIIVTLGTPKTPPSNIMKLFLMQCWAPTTLAKVAHVSVHVMPPHRTTGCPSAKNMSIVGHRIWTQNPRQPRQSFPGKTEYFSGKALPDSLGFCVQILCPTIDRFPRGARSPIICWT